jgi:hypothetical protein
VAFRTWRMFGSDWSVGEISPFHSLARHHGRSLE